MNQTQGHQTLDDRIRTTAGGVRDALAVLVGQVATPRVRPIELSRRLAIDDSLAARILRAVRSGDPLATARELPAPQGLRIFLAASERGGASAASISAAEQAVRAFEQLIEEFPTGRAGLATAIESWLPGARHRGGRASSQAIFKAMSQVVGHTSEFTSNTTIIRPSASVPHMCDALNLSLRSGMRRLRAGAPIFAMGWYHTPVDPTKADPEEADRQIYESVAGEREVMDPRKYLLEDVGGVPPPPFKLVETGNLIRLVLDRGVPPVNVPVTYAAAHVIRNSQLRYQLGERTSDATIYVTRVPTRVLHINVLLHADVYPGYAPVMVTRLHGLAPDPIGRNPDIVELDAVETNVEVQNLGWGLERTGATEMGGFRELLQGLFDRAGWDPSRFRAYRFRVQYPIPFVSLTTWFDLPPPPPGLKLPSGTPG